MKSQSLPITTIALIIIVLLALVVIVLFLIRGFVEVGEPTEGFIDTGKEKMDEIEGLETFYDKNIRSSLLEINRNIFNLKISSFNW